LYEIRSNPIPQIVNQISSQILKSYVIGWQAEAVSTAYEEFEPHQIYFFLGDIFLKITSVN
jgi:hypothetical protein